MVRARSRMKHAERALQSSGRRGGDRRVLEKPAAGVLQKIPTATELIGPILSLFIMVSPLGPARYRRSGRRCSRGRPRSAAGRAGRGCPRPSMLDRCSTRLSTPPSDVARFHTRMRAAAAMAAASPPRSRIDSIPPNPPCICRAAMAWPGWDGSPGYRSCLMSPDDRRSGAQSSCAAALWWRTRTCSVRNPRNSCEASKGPRTPPSMPRSLAQASNARAIRPNTMAPATTSEWPLRYFVAECRTRSAPSASGCVSTGVDTVESTARSAPPSWAMRAAAAMSVMVQRGLDGVSIQTRLRAARPHGGLQCGGRSGIDKRHLEPVARRLLHQPLPQPPVHGRRRNHVGGLLQCQERGRGRGHAGPEKEAWPALPPGPSARFRPGERWHCRPGHSSSPGDIGCRRRARTCSPRGSAGRGRRWRRRQCRPPGRRWSRAAGASGRPELTLRQSQDRQRSRAWPVGGVPLSVTAGRVRPLRTCCWGAWTSSDRICRWLTRFPRDRSQQIYEGIRDGAGLHRYSVHGFVLYRLPRLPSMFGLTRCNVAADAHVSGNSCLVADREFHWAELMRAATAVTRVPIAVCLGN